MTTNPTPNATPWPSAPRRSALPSDDAAMRRVAQLGETADESTAALWGLLEELAELGRALRQRAEAGADAAADADATRRGEG